MLKHIYNLATDKYSGFIPEILKFILFLLSLIYGFIIRIIRFFSGLRIIKAQCKIISVGNITLGGTGKTPLVEYLARNLVGRGKKVVVVTRGYKKTTGLALGDEALMLKEHLKDILVIVDTNRLKGIKNAWLKYKPDFIILDDSFQQWKIKKDLEIVVIDTLNPFGNRHMMPRGILREPLSALKRAEVFILTKVDLAGDIAEIKGVIRKYNTDALIVESVHEAVGFLKPGEETKIIDKNIFTSRRVALISGIANPQAFEKTVISQGAIVAAAFNFRDHHHYCQSDLDKIALGLKDKNVEAIITTAKDVVKLSSLNMGSLGVEVFILEIKLKIIKNEERFIDRLSGLCSN